MRKIAVAISLFYACLLGPNAMAAPKAPPVVKINLEVTVFEGGKVEVRRGGPRADHRGHQHPSGHKKSNQKKGKSWCSHCDRASCRGKQCRKVDGGAHRPHGDSKGHGKHRAHQEKSHSGHQGTHRHPHVMKKFDADGDGRFSQTEKNSMKNAWAKMIVARMDNDRDGKLTVDEIPAQMRDKFSKVDANNDRYVDSKELGAAMARRMKQMKSGGKANMETKPTNRDRGEMFFKRFDANEDGKVSLQEIPAGRKEMLGKVDANSDGSIDREEFRIAMAKRNQQKNDAPRPKKGKGVAISRIAEAIMQLDGNADGRLNADEVAPRLKSKFSDLDKNGDGYLDKREVKKQVKRRMQQERAASELRQPTAEQSAAARDEEAVAVASSSLSGPE